MKKRKHKYYRDILIKPTLVYLYHDKQLSQAKIAKKLKVSQAIVCLYMEKFKISKRTPSEAVSGKLNPCYGKDITGEKNPNWKNNRCGQKYCKDCGNPIGLESYYCGQGRCHKCKYKNPINHPNYIDGRTSLKNTIYNLSEYRNWRKQVFKRDNYTCQDCNKNKSGHLEAHHKKTIC